MFQVKLMCIFILIASCQAEQETVKLSAEKAVTIGNQLIKCAIEHDGDMVDFLNQLYAWNIKDEGKVKHFLHCFCSKLGFSDKGGKLVISKILAVTGDFKTKDKFIKMVDDCNSKGTGKNSVDKLFSIAECFNKNTPLLITI